MLNEVCDNIEECLKKEFEVEAALTLILDGWLNVKNDSIFAHCIYTGIKSYLFKAVYCSTEKKTAECYADFPKKMLSEIEEIYNKKSFCHLHR